MGPLDANISKYFCGDAFRVLTLFCSWNFQIAIVNRNRSVSNKQTLIWWMFLLVNEAWIFCYAEFCHTTSIQLDNSGRVIGKKIFISTLNLRCFELWMDQGILFEITRGFAKANLIKYRPKNLKKFFFSVLYTFSETVYVLHLTLERLLLRTFCL